MTVFVSQLPHSVQCEIEQEITDILQGADPAALAEAVENVFCSKLVDVIGSEPGLLSYEKYGKWL